MENKKWFTFPEPGWYGRGLKDVLIYWDGKSWTEKVRILKDGEERDASKQEAQPYTNLDSEQKADADIQNKVVVPVIAGASAFVAISTIFVAWLSNRKR